jgi:D-sedoheptulose 7-phosphate isomerase
MINIKKEIQNSIEVKQKILDDKKKIKTYALIGEIGGKMKDLCECIHVPSSITGRIQESYILIGHIVCGIVENEYFKDIK